jgi:hypothetical protein
MHVPISLEYKLFIEALSIFNFPPIRTLIPHRRRPPRSQAPCNIFQAVFGSAFLPGRAVFDEVPTSDLDCFDDRKYELAECLLAVFSLEDFLACIYVMGEMFL